MTGIVKLREAHRAGSFRGAETHTRSVLKAVSWRTLGTIDTFAISWFMTGRVEIAGSIAALEVITKTHGITCMSASGRPFPGAGASTGPSPASPAIHNSPKQPLIYHPNALPISAAFGLRYVHTLMRRWAASGMYDR